MEERGKEREDEGAKGEAKREEESEWKRVVQRGPEKREEEKRIERKKAETGKVKKLRVKGRLGIEGIWKNKKDRVDWDRGKVKRTVTQEAIAVAIKVANVVAT